ncbi:MAG: hypothetical protein Q9P01_04190 [Anaerolineae bacterium]|nr:hypothetical protein [Anaerolineae bacterium]MDQ7034043.1 hypothetical protein [Anaerolineae bacterium]
MEEKDKHSKHAWITAAKNRGLGGALHVLLDVLEPFAPLASQFLWVAQPFAGIFGARNAIGDLADILDMPNGVESLRQQLNENRSNDL